MDYSSNTRSSGNHLSTDSLPSINYAEGGLNNHSGDAGALSPVQFSIYDEKQQQHFQYQSQPPSLNQLLQNNQYGVPPFGGPSLRPQSMQNFHANYWNLPSRSQNENTYQDSYGQHGNDMSYSKIDKVKSAGEIESNYTIDGRSYQNEEINKSRTIPSDWKLNNSKTERLSPKNIQNKLEIDKKIDKSNSIEMSDNASLKSESHLTTDYNSNTSSGESSEKNDLMYHNSNYALDNKMNQTQMKHPSQMGYDNASYGQMMIHPNANYYSHLRYPNPQNNTHNYMNPNNSPMMPNAINRPLVNYPPYMQTPNPMPGYGYPQMAMHQVRTPYNVHTPYVSRSSQSPFSGHQEAYMNGSVPPLYSGGMTETSERKEEVMPPTITKQETSDSGSTSNKSATVRSSKSKNVIKNESHPTTPVSNTIPSPSQTSMSSIIDENDDSVSSLGPNDSNVIHNPVSQFNQHQISPNMSQNPSMMYPQSYPHNNQIQHPVIGSYPSNVGPQSRPFAPSSNMMPGRQYHHQNDSQINNSCFQKLLELGSEPERGPWVERYLKFMQENNTPLGAVPTVVKQPLDLFRLYHAVRERGGLLNVVKTKRWKEICHIVNVNASASGAYTLRRNYIKCLLDYECRFDRNGVDPGPILQEIQSLSDKKKKSTSRTTGSSSSSTISSGQASHHNPEFTGNPSTPRPSLPPPDFNSPHSFPGHNPYNNPLHNGSLMHRSPMHYPTGQRSPYPGPYNGPRIITGFNAPTSPMHQPVRYDSNMPPNWNKPLPMNQQQWPSPSSSTNSSSTHPMQMPMSPGTPSNSISGSSQQSQPPGDNFEGGAKDPPKLDTNMARYAMSDNVINSSDNFNEKDIDKIETSKSDTNFYNQSYTGLSGQEGSYDYYHHNKTLSNNVNPLYPPMQYPGFPFSRQYGSTFRQSAPNPLSFPSYYPPNPNYIYPPGTISHSSNLTSNSHHTTSSPSSHSPYYPIGSLQEHTRRMEWKSNYGGMPPPPPPPPNGQASTRGSVPPNITNTSQMGPSGSHSQYHSSIPHCNYTNQNHASFNQQRPINPQLPSNMMPQNRHMLQTPISNIPDPMNYLNKSVSSSSVPNSTHHMSSTTCHSRSQIDNGRLTQSYPSQYTYSKSSSGILKRYDHLFPPNCVEATQPDYSKKRKYISKDIKAFNASTVTMALKSGLVAEVSWALNHLNIWSRDDNFDKLTLKNIMPLFQALIDVWRNSLGIVFGYDLFIKDLELSVNLEQQFTKTDLKNIFNKIETVLKTSQIKTEIKDEDLCDDIEKKIKVIKEKVVEILNCGKYQSDKHSLMVKLDMTSKLDSVIGSRVELIDFIKRVLGDFESIDEAINKDRYCKYQSLSQLWEVGGSDSTFHIMPPILSQRSSIHIDWYTQLMGYNDCGCDSDNCGPPEIKRSRCISPPTSLRSSSPNPPILLHESNVTDDTPRFQSKSDVYNDGESLLFEIEEVDEEKILRCLCVSIVIRNLSFVTGNDRIMGTNRSLLIILGRLLLLGHKHNEEDDVKEDWWLKWIDDIREHVLVTLVNISSYLELEAYHECIVQPIIMGLLHWLTCQSAEAEDALPSHRVLGCKRLSLECLMRLCVHDRNIDFIVSASNNKGDLIVRQLFDFLASSFCYPEVQVVKEMSLAVMHYLSIGGSDNGVGCVYLAQAKPCIISGLISFIEITESQIRHVVENMGMEALQARPELMGTSLEFLRHSGALLNKIASHEVNRKQFSRDHEIRMLNLVISTVLDQTVAQSISGVLFLLSTCNSKEDPPNNDDDNKFRSFLTFDDLSFCDNCSNLPQSSSPPQSKDDLLPTTISNGPS